MASRTLQFYRYPPLNADYNGLRARMADLLVV